jgi:hypothetical protein
VVFIGAGILFAFLPKQWIEQALGVAPDGGSGLLELLFVAIPIAVGVVLAAHVALAERRLRWQPRRAGGGPIDRS